MTGPEVEERRRCPSHEFEPLRQAYPSGTRPPTEVCMRCGHERDGCNGHRFGSLAERRAAGEAVIERGVANAYKLIILAAKSAGDTVTDGEALSIIAAQIEVIRQLRALGEG